MTRELWPLKAFTIIAFIRRRRLGLKCISILNKSKQNQLKNKSTAFSRKCFRDATEYSHSVVMLGGDTWRRSQEDR